MSQLKLTSQLEANLQNLSANLQALSMGNLLMEPIVSNSQKVPTLTLVTKKKTRACRYHIAI